MVYSAIILAGGSGTRFGNEKKQFFEFEGKMLYEHVLDKVLTIVDRNHVIVVGVDVPGGKTRSYSVMNGLNALPSDTEKLIILEAARPLVTVKQIKDILECDGDSISYVMPCVNTAIYRNGTYINRNDLYDLLVPQCFNFKKLKAAYDTGKYTDYTDETRIMFDEYSIKPKFIETGQNLYKVTYKRDIAVLESINELMKEGKI